MSALSFLIPVLYGAAISSVGFCPPDDSVKLFKDSWSRGDTIYDDRLFFYYSVCKNDRIMVDSLTRVFYKRGDAYSGLSIAEKEFSRSVHHVCDETRMIRNDLEGRRVELDTISRTILDSMRYVCRIWGSR